MSSVQTLRVDLHGRSFDFPVLSLVDRRKCPTRKQFCVVRAVEQLLYDVGHSRSTGRFASHLAKLSMEDGVLVADRAAVENGTLLETEYDAGASAQLACRAPTSSTLPALQP